MSPYELSGWILPHGEFVEVDEWWHVSHLYELREQGFESLNLQENALILDRGDESEIRDMAARLGFVKISRGEIDANGMTNHQLRTLQEALELFDPSFEFRVLIEGGKAIKSISVSRLMKLKAATALFNPDSET